MKFLLTLALLITTNAFAIDLCSFEETWQFDEALEAQGIKPLKVSANHKTFTNVEKQLIYTAVIQQGWLSKSTMREALNTFGDFYEAGRQGENKGEIQYFNIKGQKLAIVHYWPGDNEYGAVFKHVNGQYFMIATIDDSFITCK